ncbi:monofunctional biosynthetic peptidoglycan transglycosylase [Hyphomicrobium sp. D-2]|uniref:monofunctional biosynthetic peptidoglycan transglycosylase n=1 Tax=Hyphomicrobium sp. D-2 TaxID=3041621 RepID=UPI0024589280|nr:monofunctional biosynthetic peptidoglycan transglycosylase [Hyphomicrobium sp. D-2]MDH4983737.1 monofunctional biosynthetic peptidoglycan transglycosylase [Hyphomicrobium sp. D-2]
MERSDPPRPLAKAFPASPDGQSKPSDEDGAVAGVEAHGASPPPLETVEGPVQAGPFLGFTSMVGPDLDGPSVDANAAETAAGDESDRMQRPVDPVLSEEPPPTPELFPQPADAFPDGVTGVAMPQEIQTPTLSEEAAVADHPVLATDTQGVPALEPWPDPLETARSDGDVPGLPMAAAEEISGSQPAEDFADVAKTANAANEAPQPMPSGAAVAGFEAGEDDAADEAVASDLMPPAVAAEPTAGGNAADTALGLAPADTDAPSFVPEMSAPISAPVTVPDIGAWRAPEPALPSLDAPTTPQASKLSLHPDSHSDWTPSVEVTSVPETAAPGPDFSRMWSAPQAAAIAPSSAFVSAAHAADIGWHSPPSAAPASGQPERRDWKAFAYRVARIGFFVLVGWFAFVLALVVLYRFVNPPFSMLMAQQWLTGTSIQKQWVPLEQISPNLQRAVVVSEDSRFCQHWGIDLEEMANAIRRSSGGYPRGASTITMQLAKNLFLLPTKSYLRKMVEVPLTVAIELTWPKARILEVYLNVVEWGPGVFGAEAASRTHFKRPASQLTARQAAQLAVSLPNPIVRNAGRPGPLVRKRAGVIQQRAAGARGVLSCIDQGR